MRTFFLASALAAALVSTTASAATDTPNYCQATAAKQFPGGFVGPLALSAYPVMGKNMPMILFLASDNPTQGWNISIGYPDEAQRDHLAALANSDGAWMIFKATNNMLEAQIYINDSANQGCYNLFPQPISALPLGVLGHPPS